MNKLIALTAKPLARQKLNALAGGLSQAPLPFKELPYVEEELQSIKEAGVTTVTLYNDKFKSKILEQTINAQPFQVIHLATGKFSSKASETFILASDKRIYVAELN